MKSSQRFHLSLTSEYSVLLLRWNNDLIITQPVNIFVNSRVFMYVEKINSFEHDKAIYVFKLYCILHYILMFVKAQTKSDHVLSVFSSFIFKVVS